MITVDARQVRAYEKDLKTFKARAYPFATKQTINSAAFMARGFAQENIREQMVERNKWTARSVQVEMARGLVVAQQQAAVGSVAPYMETQEFGGTKRTRGKEGVPIPTSYSAGQGENAQPRTRLPRKANTLQAIQLRRQIKKGNRKQRNLVAIRTAVSTGQRFVYLELQRRRGLFRITGGKRNPQIKMVWDLSRPVVVIPRNPWLKPATDRTVPQLPALYQAALIAQLERHGLFRSHS